MTRRTRLIVQGSAVVVIVASLMVARILSIESDRVGLLGVAQAGLFVAFAVAALTLFATVVMDFDRWVDTVPPVPKRTVRRWAGRNVRRISRLLALALAWFGAVMSWVWSTLGEALGWALSRSGTGLSLLWVSLAGAGAWVLARYRAGAGWLWSSAGRGFAWTLARAGEGLTWVWVWVLGAFGSMWVGFRAGMRWLWLSAGRGFAWVLARAGEGLTWLWVWLVRAAGSLWVGFRAGMRLVWLSTARGFAWVLARAGEGLTWFWVWITRAGASLLIRFGAGISWMWRATLGRERVASTNPRRRWYTTAVDSAFGIPPEGTPLEPVPGRRPPRRPRPANRPRPLRRPSYRDEGETVNLRNATRTSTDTELTRDPRALYVGRQVTRRGGRRKSEELLAAALARFRPARSQSRDREEGREGR